MGEPLGGLTDIFGGFLGASAGLMGAFWAPLGASSGHLAANHGLPQRPGHDLECFGGRLGPSWAVMGLSSGHLGALLGRLGALLNCLGALWNNFVTIFGAFRAVSDARKTEEPSSQKSHKNQQKIVVFCVSRASWGCSLGCLRASGRRLGPLGALAGPFSYPPDRFLGPAG